MENKWNCSKCKREIISEKKGNFCLECGWKQQVEKIEITPEAIRSFMEKYCFIGLTFQKWEYWDLIQIEAKNRESFLSNHYYPAGLVRLENVAQYYPRTKKNIKKNFFGREVYNDCSTFLEKLFYFAQNENIKRIRVNWRVEISDKLGPTPASLKVDNIVIEKKTVEEIEKED